MKLSKIVISIGDEMRKRGYFHCPAFLGDDGWYYYTEYWADVVGPHETQKIAVDALHEYANQL